MNVSVILKWERYINWVKFNSSFGMMGNICGINNKELYLQILARDGEQNENEKWITLIGDLAGCISIKRPKEVIKCTMDDPNIPFQSCFFSQ